MSDRRPVLLSVCLLLTLGVCTPVATLAQSAVGSGPLTGSLADTEPTIGILSYGRVKIAPGLTVREIGWDDNIFSDAAIESPQGDYVASAQPDLAVYARLRFIRVSAYASSELTYYRTHEEERSIGHAGRGRVDFLLSRMRPFVGGGRTRTRTRPNGEIDVRADRILDETSGGLAFDLSSHSLVYASVSKAGTSFDGFFQDGADLKELSRVAFDYQAGLKTDLTPLLSMQLYGSYQQDTFATDPNRNGVAKQGTAVFQIAPDALITGQVSVSYRDAHFTDPGVEDFRGVVGSASLTYPILEIGRLSFSLQRGLEYSFDAAAAYYLANTGTLTYTQRLVGGVDLQGRVARSLFDYSARVNEPAHTERLAATGASLGYNLRNRTRIALNYEHADRRSSESTLRNYRRRRVFLSWSLAL